MVRHRRHHGQRGQRATRIRKDQGGYYYNEGMEESTRRKTKIKEQSIKAQLTNKSHTILAKCGFFVLWKIPITSNNRRCGQISSKKVSRHPAKTAHLKQGKTALLRQNEKSPKKTKTNHIFQNSFKKPELAKPFDIFTPLRMEKQNGIFFDISKSKSKTAFFLKGVIFNLFRS